MKIRFTVITFPLLQTLVVSASAFVASLVVRRFLLARIEGAGPVSAHVSDQLRVPSFLWTLAIALNVAVRFSELPEKYANRIEQVILVFVIVSLTFVADAIARRLLAFYGRRENVPHAVAGLSFAIARILVFSIGAMLLLRHFNVAIAPMVTALGVSGLAVALALQDTLSNFFAGIHIFLETPVSVGDWIKLGPEEEGAVQDIGWRTTRILTSAGNILVVPNNKISTGIITNFSLPTRDVIGEVPVLASQQADPDQLQRIAIECALDTEGVAHEPPPAFVPDPGVTPTHLQFKLVFHAHGKPAAGKAKNEIGMKIMRRMRAEGIPFPEAKS